MKIRRFAATGSNVAKTLMASVGHFCTSCTGQLHNGIELSLFDLLAAP